MSGQSPAARSSGPRVVLHVGLPKTGTTYLQAMLRHHRTALRELGIDYPALGPEVMFRAAVEVRGSHDLFGLGRDDVAGRWRRLCDHARGFDGVTVMGHEVLSGASVDQIRNAWAALSDLDVDVVITARDLGRLAVAYWQERVKLGDPWTFEQWAHDALEPELHGRRPEPRAQFWHAYDLAETVTRWASVAGPSRTSVVLAPPPGASTGELWTRFVAGAGLDARAARLDPAPPGLPANPSLGRTQVALLRQVDQRLSGRLTTRQRAIRVKRHFAERVLPPLGPREPLLTPAGYREPFAAITETWLRDLDRLGVRIVGDPSDLHPVCGSDTDPRPDDVGDLLGLARAALNAVDRDPPPLDSTP